MYLYPKNDGWTQHLFFRWLQGAEISATDENPLESGVLRMWKINCKNVNSIKPFKTEELRVMSQRKVVRALTALAVVFVIVITNAGFCSASSICTGALTTVPLQCLLFVSSAYLNNFAFSSSGHGQHNYMMVFWFSFLVFLLESAKYQHYQGIYDANMWSLCFCAPAVD